MTPIFDTYQDEMPTFYVENHDVVQLKSYFPQARFVNRHDCAVNTVIWSSVNGKALFPNVPCIVPRPMVPGQPFFVPTERGSNIVIGAFKTTPREMAETWNLYYNMIALRTVVRRDHWTVTVPIHSTICVLTCIDKMYRGCLEAE